ncbi:putative EF-hand domain-containing protein [Helianthus annuus]|nr:putative EF-hand domain-containing protein [Helianthus annuus]
MSLLHLPEFCARDSSLIVKEIFGVADEDAERLRLHTVAEAVKKKKKKKKTVLFIFLISRRERDSDRDGKINFKEFFHGLFDLVRNYDDEAHNSSHESTDSLESPARNFFAQLDKDGDRYLSDVELLSIIGKLHPSERYYAKQQADYIISQVIIYKINVYLYLASCHEVAVIS